MKLKYILLGLIICAIVFNLSLLVIFYPIPCMVIIGIILILIPFNWIGKSIIEIIDGK